MNKLLPIAWLASIVVLAGLASLLQSESSHFFGITDNSEQTISFSYPVELVQNLVVEGIEVQQGQPILEVRRPDLSAKLTFIEDQIRAATALHEEMVVNTRAELMELRAQRATDIAELDVQIETLQARRIINGKLLEDISGNEAQKPYTSPLTTEVRGLKAQREHLQDSFVAHIANLELQLATEADRFKTQIAESQNRKIDLERQLTDLVVRAKIGGRIGSVNYKSGEQIAPFMTILTVHSTAPQFVKGYIHENVYNQVSIDQTVWVQRFGTLEHDNPIQASVESLGSRIVEYPMRLKVNQLVSAWGREAVIRLPPATSLLLGEKVIVSMRSPKKNMGWLTAARQLMLGGIGNARAAESSPLSGPTQQTLAIRSEIPDLASASIEASGIVVGTNPDEFFIVSDEAGVQTPQLLVMNARGEITSTRPIITNVDIDDMESISRVGEAIYVSASLSPTKKGNRKENRCQLLRLVPEKDELVARGHLNLCGVLEQLAKTSIDRETRRFLIRATANRTIDVESHAISEGKLYLGFKAPLDDRNNTVILQIDNLDGLFAGKPAQGRIWQRLALSDPDSGVPVSLSDMHMEGDQLLLLGISKNHNRPSSHLWKLDLKKANLILLHSIPGLRAEGISGRLADGRRAIVFDGNGKRHSRLVVVPENG
ncbi:hypothetical protein MNBD_GAMMA13-907 [hydrothermal vent metagenome]|uniref:RND efflux pump membrane fusion protein barrel-sandwich domain-containing protein n=1 Tax=hydrothermal vent metagenome TaxID=652676 RepID=A0A3B0ZGP3_9ZZZZ